MSNRYALIMAGGSGSRMKSDLPKQFICIAGKPILMHTLERFVQFDAQIQLLLVLPQAQISFWEGLCKQHNFKLPHQRVAGGDTRFHSVKNGLAAIGSNEGLVGIHDGVRPLVSVATIAEAFAVAERLGNALPVAPVIESLRIMQPNGTSEAVERAAYRSVQTPQVFRNNLIREAYHQEYTPFFTDDASVLEANGGLINLVAGNPENIKITTPMDLALADLLLNRA